MKPGDLVWFNSHQPPIRARIHSVSGTQAKIRLECGPISSVIFKRNEGDAFPMYEARKSAKLAKFPYNITARNDNE